MKNIIIPEVKKEIINRINLLEENSTRLWGKMSASEMLCHCSDQIKMATGVLKTDFVGNFFSRTIGKSVVLLGAPAPKGKIETVKELKQGALGTKPINFDEDKMRLIKFISDFDTTFPKHCNPVHPAFGVMTKNQWARLTYLHLDHHLKQFGK